MMQILQPRTWLWSLAEREYLLYGEEVTKVINLDLYDQLRFCFYKFVIF